MKNIENTVEKLKSEKWKVELRGQKFQLGKKEWKIDNGEFKLSNIKLRKKN